MQLIIFHLGPTVSMFLYILSYIITTTKLFNGVVGWYDGPGKTSSAGASYNLDDKRAMAVGAGGGCLDIFTLLYPFSPLSPSLWETARYRLTYCPKGPLNPKQPTNQLNCCSSLLFFYVLLYLWDASH